ncbi:MAG: two-component sensor histidine kinase [Frankiales bacterium]|nr:two-component sensor histidine kinase [Frankiales bacterium]
MAVAPPEPAPAAGSPFATSRLAALSARTPLRIKLVAAVVALAAFGLFASGLAASTALHNYLQSRVDAQLTSYAGRPNPFGGPGGGPQGEDSLRTVFTRGVWPYVGPYFGKVVEKSVPGLAGPLLPTTVPQHPITVTSRKSGEAPWRIIGTFDGNGNPAVIGLNLQEVVSTTHQLIVLESTIGGIVLLALAGGGYIVVRRSLRPLVAVETTAEAIAAGDLTQRVPESDPRTEVGSLSRSFNAMLTQIETAFAERSASEAEARASEIRMRRFVGDASHELRTPLTSIRGFAELYRQGALPAQADVDRAMNRVENEAARMGLLVDDLLLLARLDQQRPLERAPVDLLELAGDAVQDAKALDPARSVHLEVVATGPAPVVSGDAQRLRQVFGNLVANALTHTPPATPVVLRVSSTASTAVVEVVDSGPGIAPEDRPRVFERFFRTDSSRTRASGGSGLGLSIVAALVAAHGGHVDVEETPGGGATFRVSLPLA